MNDDLQRAADLIRASRLSIAMTGAGISVDSGIPDFRSASGPWARFDPMEYATIQAFRANPEKVWTMLAEMEGLVTAAKPNAGHAGLAALEEAGRLHAVITQNIDNLHQEAGSRVVIEYHGNGKRLVCLDCRGVFDAADIALKKEMPPRCGVCRSVLKPDVVLFGEAIPPSAARQSMELARQCTLVLVVGTSAEVYPAGEIPVIAKDNGAALVEINRAATRLTPFVDVSLRGSATAILPALVNLIRQKNIA
ncbi:MAG: NAD-dependent deacylase [Deltaproteobacteria bacterium]|nr:NAD-dependent deacylase [Deltaproteobacteria bacterium]